MHEAKTHLSKLIDEAVQGKSFIVTKASKPLVKVIAIEDSPETKLARLGFMLNQFTVPDDFDVMGHDVIQHMFGDV